MSSGIGIANLPNQVGLHRWVRRRRRSLVRFLRGTELSPNAALTSQLWSLVSVMSARTLETRCLRLCIAAGESGLGKTTLINTLFATELSPPKNYSRRHVKQLDKLTEVSWSLDPPLARCRNF